MVYDASVICPIIPGLGFFQLSDEERETHMEGTSLKLVARVHPLFWPVFYFTFPTNFKATGGNSWTFYRILWKVTINNGKYIF